MTHRSMIILILCLIFSLGPLFGWNTTRVFLTPALRSQTVSGPSTILKRVAPAQKNGAVNVQSYGAVGNGKADDTAALQAAIDSLKVGTGTSNFPSNQTGGTVFLPAGKYVISSALSVYEGIWLVGDGMFATQIYNANTAGDNAIELVPSGRQVAGAAEYFGGVRDMDIAGNSSSGDGIRLQGFGVCYTSFERLLIRNHGGNGIYIHKTVGSSWRDVYSIYNYGWGLNINGGPLPGDVSTVHSFHSCQIRENGLRQDGSGGGYVAMGVACNFDGRCIIESNIYGPGMWVKGTYNTFENLYFENNASSAGNDVQLKVTGYGNTFTGTYLNDGKIWLTDTASNNQFLCTKWSLANPNLVIDANCYSNQVLYDQPIYARHVQDNGPSNFYCGNRGIYYLNGDLRFASGNIMLGGGSVYCGNSTLDLTLAGGSSRAAGARIELYGENHPTLPRVVRFTANDIERARFDPNGYLGVGTDDPQTRLDVAGTIRAREGLIEDVKIVTAGISSFDTRGIHIISSNAAPISGALADGTIVGQTVKFVCKVAGNNIDITVSHHVTSDPEVIRLDAAKEWVELVWDGADWVEVGGNGQSYP